MENKKNNVGHMAAFFTVFIWGTTFISTKILLADFQPVEILFFRFILGFTALCLADLRRMKGTTLRQECIFASAGLCGICLYYLLENVALTYTLASNTGVIVSTAPFFTVLLLQIVTRGKERVGWNFYVGFLISMAGICLIGFNGARMELNPLGDLLAVGSAVMWAFYSLLTRRIGSYGYSTVQTTRRIFFYGILWMTPAVLLSDFQWGFARFIYPVNVLNILYLGLGASALCFVTWNYAVKTLGVVKTSAYIYLTPLVTVIVSAMILNERITPVSAAGTCLTLAGLVLSEKKMNLKRSGEKDGSEK